MLRVVSGLVRAWDGKVRFAGEEITGTPPRSPLVDIKGEEFYGAGYEDSDRLPPDITKIRSLGWSPRHDLKKTLRDAMSYYLEPGCEDRRQVYVERPLSQTVGADLVT